MDGCIVNLSDDWEYQQEDFRVSIIQQNALHGQPMRASDIDLEEKEEPGQYKSNLANSEMR